jgi:hypothetical protein
MKLQSQSKLKIIFYSKFFIFLKFSKTCLKPSYLLTIWTGKSNELAKPIIFYLSNSMKNELNRVG